MNVPLESNKSIFSLIRSDKEKINPRDTAGINRINYIDETGKEKANIGQTKKERGRARKH